MARITEARITKAETLAGQSGGGSLNTAEQAELARLEAATAIEGEKIRSGTMTEAECDDWLHRHSIDGDDGTWDRLVALRRRADPAQTAADDAEKGRIAKMSREELQAYLRERGVI